jgi:1-acyl-sn-glycerol-3-phosphate acyltransferase
MRWHDSCHSFRRLIPQPSAVKPGASTESLVTSAWSSSDLIAGARTIAAYIFCSVYTLVLGPIGLILAVAFRWPNALYQLAIVAVRTALAIVGIRYVVEGEEHIDGNRPSVYCVNHASNLEPPILFHVLSRIAPRLQILYKAVLHRLPVLGWGFDIVGFVPIERGNREQSSKAIDQATDQLRKGNSFLVFPEGTRSRTGELLPFKKGAFILAIRAQAPLVPMAITGARAAMRKGSFIIRPTIVHVKIGPPVPTKGLGLDARDSLIAELRSRMQGLLHAISERAPS